MATESVDRPKIRISYNRGKRAQHYPSLRLPFVGGGNRETSNWCLPPAQGYTSGCNVGTAAAQMLLKYYRDGGQHEKGARLQSIVLSMVAAGAPRGEIVGFFTTLDRWLRQAACSLGASLDQVSEEELVETMEYAINETPTEELARLEATYGVSARALRVEATVQPSASPAAATRRAAA